MANVLLWVIGVVCNYNTMTRRVNRFLSQNDPTEVMVATPWGWALDFFFKNSGLS
ncbi:MAG TPA: hypothetical protein VFF71_08560 [Luteimonas sp.]|nr:hypothetical protein [Luteimonas sp.]